MDVSFDLEFAYLRHVVCILREIGIRSRSFASCCLR